MKIKPAIIIMLLLILLFSISFSSSLYAGNHSSGFNQDAGNRPVKKEDNQKNKLKKGVDPVKKNFKRALGEALLVEMGATYNYWRKYVRFIEDWQYKLTWADQKKRFLPLKLRNLIPIVFR